MLVYVNFPEQAVPVDPAIMRRLAYLYLPVSAVFTFAAIGVLGFDSNGRRSHDANLALLRAGAARNGAAATPPAGRGTKG